MAPASSSAALQRPVLAQDHVRVDVGDGFDQPHQGELAAGEPSDVIEVDDAQPTRRRCGIAAGQPIDGAGQGAGGRSVGAQDGRGERAAAAGDPGRRSPLRDSFLTSRTGHRHASAGADLLVELDLAGRDGIPRARLGPRQAGGAQPSPPLGVINEFAYGAGQRVLVAFGDEHAGVTDDLRQRAAGIADDDRPGGVGLDHHPAELLHPGAGGAARHEHDLRLPVALGQRGRVRPWVDRERLADAEVSREHASRGRLWPGADDVEGGAGPLANRGQHPDRVEHALLGHQPGDQQQRDRAGRCLLLPGSDLRRRRQRHHLHHSPEPLADGDAGRLLGARIQTADPAEGLPLPLRERWREALVDVLRRIGDDGLLAAPAHAAAGGPRC